MAKRILITDDAAFMRMMLKDNLNPERFWGMRGSGKVAIDKFKELKPVLVTLDITMPEMDGLQALQTFKTETRLYFFDTDAE